jgi:nicotinate-nucleotide adenylyltransferase
MVAGEPPHKNTAENISDACRLEMVSLAIENEPNILIDDREIYRSGKSYSYISMTEIKNEHPTDEIFFIMGSDSLLYFKDWVKPEIISECATILVAPRLGDDLDKLEQAIHECKSLFEGEFFLIDYEANGLASSSIRKDFYKDESVREGLNQKVIDYILEHNLYSPYSYDYSDILKLSQEMQKELKPSRYVHTLGVATTAYSLALKWNYPAYTAMVAGILHDCAKCISDEKRINVCEKNNIPIREIEYKYPHLLHGKVGAYYCKSKYKVYDEQIAHAIAVHTTGCPGMNLLDKIIFVADYIEPGRDKQPRLDILRSEAYTDLDNCVFMILEDTVNYLNENPEMVDSTTIDTYNYYLNEMKGKVENGF